MQSTTSPSNPGYTSLLAQIEWLENGKQAPELRIELRDLLAALADMQDNDGQDLGRLKRERRH